MATQRGRQGSGGTLVLRRRDMLRIAGASTVGIVATQVPGLASAEAATKKRTRTVYRLATLGQTACNACKAHDANRYYRTSNAANLDRAHRGCNCAIVTQQLPINRWNKFFKQGGADRTVFDLRWIRTDAEEG